MAETFTFNGKKLNYVSEWIKGTLWVHVNGKTFSVAQAGSKRKRRGQESISHNKVMSQMPGKITKIFVQEGQVVQKGQPVVVMEAMKMEYTLKAELTGPIEKFLAKVGAQVSVGDLLIQIAQEPE